MFVTFPARKRSFQVSFSDARLERMRGRFNQTTKQKNMTTSKFIKIAMGAVLLTGILTQAQAQDKKVDPSGTYIWTQAGRNGGPDRTNTLVLKLTGDKLTGKVSAPGRGGGPATDTDITDGKVTGSDVSFSVVRDMGGNTITTKYSGKVADGAIKGKIEMDRGNGPTSRDWEAKLQK
jgi:hypothetical protein